MKKYIFSLMTLFVIALSGLSLTACSDDDLVTDQYKQGVNLNVFGPSPVMRGGTLRFLGSNLDQIESITIPGCDPITNIEVVQAGIPSEIRVTVPQDGSEEGKIKLTTKTGNEIWTQTGVTYTEPIVINTITPGEAMPGDTITISGDYLNLIHMVAFTDEVYVSEDDFTAHDRYTISVIVPDEAKTGKLGLYDADITKSTSDNDVSYNIIETEEALTVGTPTISKLKGRSEVDPQGTIIAKRGETITISGEYFKLVSSIEFGDGDNKYTEENFNVSEDGKTITLELNELAPDGDINLVSKSGVQIPVGKLEAVAPTELAAAPSPVKNLNTLTITGKDLDVIKTVTFPNCDAQEVQANETSIAVQVPEKAQEGDITLTMANGKSVTVAYTLVKPAVTKYSANPVSAGGALTITGTDLDLVASVTFNGSEENVAVEAESEGTIINLTCPMDAESGAVTLNLKNGTTVTAAEIAVEEAKFCYATALPGDEDEIHAGGTVTLTVKNQDKLTGVQIAGTDCQYVLSKDQLIIGVPEAAKKNCELKLISSNGQISYTIYVIPNTETTTVLWTGFEDMGSWSNQPYYGAETMFSDAGAAAGDVVRIYFTPTQDWYQFQLFNGHWGALSISELGGGQTVSPETAADAAAQGYFEFVLTDDLLSQLTSVQGWGGALLTQGENCVITKITMTHYESLETELWSGEAVCDDWGNQPYLLSDAGTELAAAGAKVGQTLRFYLTPTDATWNLQIVEGHWSGVTYCDYSNANWDLAAHNGAIEITITQAMLDAAYTQQWWGGTFIGNGDNVKITKITIE